ncbi:hypothetical protein AJ79_08749 [Helicocarpus griseus UAMH5409]|uniref:alpha-1,2-Mannosidase n=1 Tax=Helicocarpus griseus UAMH5409 TaxID=1447875 RepID=A0A2B7WHN3_9EURO|nr:hypothetical protein AJ79_08749 [Helicocarpus griseus UAMH5409]
MLASRRKWITYIVLSAVGLFFYLLGSSPDTSAGGYSNLSTPPEKIEFQWEKYDEKYPVEWMVSLPLHPIKKLPKIQYGFPEEFFKVLLPKQKMRQEAVKESFLRAWKTYKEYAWMHDEVTPLTRVPLDSFGGWAATLVDSLDTLWIMDLKDEFQEAVLAVSKIDFRNTEAKEINVFETTIRYLGGLLSAYDLSGEQILLDKATELGNILYVAFDTPNRMPVTRWNIHSTFMGLSQEANSFCLLAEIGSLTMEFTRLSQLTGDPKWHDAVDRIMEAFSQQQKGTRLPGMFPVVVNARAKNFQGRVDTFSLGAMSDSFYEYLPKMHALLGGVDQKYGKMYRYAMDVAKKHILYRPMVPDNANILISGKVTAYSETDIGLNPEGQHLVCFAGGMFALGSKLFDIPEHMDIAHMLTDGCTWSYKATRSGMMPEVFHMVPCPTKEPCEWDEGKFHEAVVTAHFFDKNDDQDNSPQGIIDRERLPLGIRSMQDRRYILRPEAIESVFVLYRTTGRMDLLDKAWEMFAAIEGVTKTAYGNAGLDDVTIAREAVAAGDAPLSDRMESFWLAETLKYFYLMFSDPNLISLDEYVLNTEAHPFKRAG